MRKTFVVNSRKRGHFESPALLFDLSDCQMSSWLSGVVQGMAIKRCDSYLRVGSQKPLAGFGNVIIKVCTELLELKFW